jgi:hypothetical protein
MFEYRMPPNMKSVGKKRIKDPMPATEQYQDEREFKVRIVERLSNIEQRLNSKAPSPEMDF